jgi:type IV pilus assembly protein PilC
MAHYTYEAMNNLGQSVRDEVEATSSEDAIAKIRAKGYFPTKIKERAAKRPSKAKAGVQAAAAATPTKRRTVGKVKQKLLTQFTRQLATLIEAGLPILRSLRILEQQQKPGMMRVAIRLVAEDVEAGSALSEAMGRHPKAFDRLYTNMIRAGEIGGVLELILKRLAEFMEKRQALRRKVIGAMIYPAAVITFAVLIVMFLLWQVVPKFEKIFDGLGTDLPGVTQALLGLSKWIQSGGWAVIIGFPFFVFFVFRLLRLSDGGRHFADSTKLHVPIVGRIAAKSAVARFSRTLGVLLDAGVPILEAVNITADTSGNEVYARALRRVHDGIREGENFAEPLRQAKIVEPMVVNMIDVGEETGELDKMLEKVAETYEEEVETLVASLTSLLEPIMVITLGIIVGFIVLALFLPLVKMIQTFQGQG